MFCWFILVRKKCVISRVTVWKSRKECDRRNATGPTRVQAATCNFFFQILIMYNFMFGEENEPNDNNWSRGCKPLGEGE